METKLQESNTFAEEICAIPGGEGIRLCIQCGTCSASCPNANRMDHTPRELIAMARSGMREEVLSSNSMWFCLSCYLCTVRCPREVKPADLMQALEYLAVRQGLSQTRTRTAATRGGFPTPGFRRGRIKEKKLQPEGTRQLRAILDKARGRRERP